MFNILKHKPYFYLLRIRYCMCLFCRTMSRATVRERATCSTCVANLRLSILAAALHGEETGEAENEHDDRAGGHCSGEVQIPTGAFMLQFSLNEK